MKRKRTGVLACLTLLLSTLLAAAIVQAAGYNLTSAGAITAINGAVFEVFSPDDPSGSGLFDPLVRISSTLVQTRGYNTDYRPLQFQENNSGTFTRSRLLSDIPQVAVNGTMYREFQLDINQNTTGNDRYLTLDTVELYESPFPDLCGYPFDGSGGGHTGCALNNTATMVYGMDLGEDNFLVLDYTNNEGAGKRDLKLLVPDSTFSADPDCNCGGEGCAVYVILYAEFGGDSDPGDPDPRLQVAHGNNDGHEEWGVQGTRPATGLEIAITGPYNVTLSWATDTGDPGYDVYRSTQPYAGFTLLAADQTGGSFEDMEALGDPATNHFYTVQSSCGSGGGAVTPAGNTVGEFDFALVPGS